MLKLSRLTVPLLAVLILAGCGGTSATHHALTRESAGGSVHPAGWGKPAPPSAHPAPNPFAATSTGVMYDAVDLSQIPANPFAAAGYTAGNWVTYPRIRSAWPGTHAVSIAIRASDHADCLDVEPGDAVPSQAPGWVRADQAAGFKRPCVYSSYYEYRDQVIPALNAAGISRSAVYEWDADYRGCNGTIDTGFDATQCTDKALGRNLDESVVTLDFLSIAQPPYGVTPPKPRTVCWGKGSTPTGSACKAIEAQAKHDWTQYLAFHKGLLAHQAQATKVNGVIFSLQKNKASVYQSYKGPGLGYLTGRIAAEEKYGALNKTRHDALVKAHHA